MVRNGVQVSHARHNDLIATPVTAKNMGGEGAYADFQITGMVFLVYENRGAESRVAKVLAHIKAVVVIYGKPFEHLIAELFPECPVVERGVGAEGAEKADLFVPDPALLEEMEQ